jgi:hypothetical protein
MSIGDAIRSAPPAGLQGAGFQINQTSFMFGACLFAFLFYITAKGDLSKWLGLLGLAGSGNAGSGNAGSGNAAPTSSFGSAGASGSLTNAFAANTLNPSALNQAGASPVTNPSSMVMPGFPSLPQFGS